MNTVLDIIKNQISPFVNSEEKDRLLNLNSLDKVEYFIEKHLEKDSVFEIQDKLLSYFEKSHIKSVESNDAIVEMPPFDSLSEPDYSGVNNNELPILGVLNEALHDFEHYVASNLYRVVEIKKSNSEKEISDWDLINRYDDLISNSSEFSRLKKVYIMSIHDSIEYPERTNVSVKKINRVLEQAKEVIDSINSLKIEKEAKKSITS